MSRRMVVVGLLFFAFILLAAALVRHLDGPRVVARAHAPDGTEFLVMQRCNWGGEPFTTACYYRKPGGPWGWFYYDHEDWYWPSAKAKAVVGEKQISIYRDGKVAATFNWETEVFYLAGLNRTMHKAQSWLPLDKTPWNWR